MTFGWRFILTMVIALVMLFSLALCGYRYWEEGPENTNLLEVFRLASAETQPELCMDEKTREQIRGVMLDALDASLKTHIEHVFEVWLKDDRGQPGRARTGVTQGIKAYLGARKNTLEWAPPLCTG